MTDWIDRFMIFVMLPFLAFLMAFVISLTVHLAAKKVAEKQCLERGYPKAAMTWDFDGYCMTLDGSTTVRVEEL